MTMWFVAVRTIAKFSGVEGAEAVISVSVVSVNRFQAERPYISVLVVGPPTPLAFSLPGRESIPNETARADVG